MGILNVFKYQDIMKIINNKNKMKRLIIYFVCCTILSASYNIFFVKNNLVIGGMGGLAIVFKKIFGMNTSLFLILSTIILLIISIIMIGFKDTKNGIFGAIIYPIIVSLTEPLTACISIEFNSYFFMILIASITYSIPLGIIYKIGYSTGGSDIINKIICKRAKTSIGQAGNYINTIIIALSSFIFGIPQSIYAVFSLLLINTIIDFVVLGNSDSKLCIIKTQNVEKIESFLINDFNIGYSVLGSTGGIDLKKRRTILCVVSSIEYERFKNLILNIDHNSFFVAHDCYEVLGGFSKRIMKFN